MLFGVCCLVVIDVSCSGACIATGSSERAYCEGAAGSGALGSLGTPDGTVSFVGGATSCVRFCCPWVNGVVVTGAVSNVNPCEPGVGKPVVLRFVIGLV